MIGSHKSITCSDYSFYYGALQLGPDGKIYSAHCCDTTLGVINNPDSLDLSCNYVNNGVNLGGRICKLGLPSIAATYVLPLFDTTQVLLCANRSYLLSDGRSVNTSGVYNCHVSTPSSCDSIVITKIILVPIDTTTISLIICSSQLPYLWHGQSLTQTGTYFTALNKVSGCDSILKFNFRVSPTKDTGHINMSICDKQLPYLWNGNSYMVTGIYNILLTNVDGCDSIAQLNLLVKYSSNSTLDTFVCNDNLPFIWNGHIFQSSGHFDLTLPNSDGCNSIVSLNLSINSKSYSIINDTFCENTMYVLPWGTIVTSSGNYYDTIRYNRSGCDSLIRIINLAIKTKPKSSLMSEYSLCVGDSLDLFPGLFDSYLWQDGLTKSHYQVRNAGIYFVTVFNSCGFSTATSTVLEKLCNEYFPNAFTPNGDGKNDRFKILNGFNLKNYNLLICNRWGQKLFETKEVNKGWDGTFKGNLQKGDSYVYYYLYEKNGIKRNGKGNILLVR